MTPLILMYHRIAELPLDHWGLAVSPGHFEAQLDVLRRMRRPLPLNEFVTRFTAGTLPADAVAVTFDDGYVDNLIAAKPRLAAADVQATVFLITGYLDRPEPFWWDELVDLIMSEGATTRFDVTIGSDTVAFDLDAHGGDRESETADAARMTRRRAVLDALYWPLRRLNETNRQAALVQLRSAFQPRDDEAISGRPMTSEEVKSLVSDGLVTIGAHTVYHAALTELEPAAREREIVDSKRTCEVLLGTPVTALAYPFGEYSDGVRDAVAAAGFACAVSTRRGAVTAGSDVLTLPRLYIPDQDGEAFAQRLCWASGDD